MPAAIEFDLPIRWGDLDAQGHVNNASLLEYLQEARVRFLNSGPAGAMLDDGVVVTKHQVEYLQAIEYSREPLQVSLWVSTLGASRYSIGYDVCQRGTVCVRAETTCCPFDFTNQTPRRLRADERAQMASVFVDHRAVMGAHLAAVTPPWHEHSLQVRWSDQDQYRHVNNVLYYDYFQEARADMLSHVAGNNWGVMWLVARQDVEYLAQLNYRSEPYRVRTCVVREGRTSLTFAADITDDNGTIFALARSVLVAADPATGKPTPLPDQIKQRLVG